MSTGTVKQETANLLHVEYDVAKTFVFDNRYVGNQTLLNASGGVLSIPVGTLLGRVSASLKLVPLAAAATDGSEKPFGILATGQTDMAIAGEANVNVCVFGDVVESKVVLNGAETMDTLIGGVRIGDLIASETQGINLVADTAMTQSDNS